MIRKNLGGDRLGSGNKLPVELEGYGRSNSDLGYVWRSSMAAGTLVPFMKKLILPGSTFDINLDVDVMTHPTIGPLFGSYKIQLDVFFTPLRLYIAKLHNNALGVGRNMSAIKLPYMYLYAALPPTGGYKDIDNAQINPSCILSYLGIRGVGMVGEIGAEWARTFNAVPLLAYWDIYKNYYANKQEEQGAVIHTQKNPVIDTVSEIRIDGQILEDVDTPGEIRVIGLDSNIEIDYAPTINLNDVVLVDTNNNVIKLSDAGTVIEDDGTTVTILWNFATWGERLLTNWQYASTGDPEIIEPNVVMFQLDQIDAMREWLLTQTTMANAINTANLPPYSYVLGGGGQDFRNMINTQEGLGLKTYQSDLFNSWINTEWIDGVGGVNEISRVDTSGGSFSMNALILAKKVFDVLNRIDASGGSYQDWLEAVYATNARGQIESPVYHGGLIRELIFQEVVSNSESTGESGTQPLGTLAGKGAMAQKKKGGKVVIKANEPGYIMGIVSLTPRIDYSQGNDWDIHLQTMDDLHKPGLDQIGFEDLSQEELAWWTTSSTTDVDNPWVMKFVGKQPAWTRYKTSVNRTYGNFAIRDNEMFMTLNRRYENSAGDSNIDDLTTYIDPAKFNNIFAETSLDAQNFWVQIGVDIEARQVMSAKVMPTL